MSLYEQMLEWWNQGRETRQEKAEREKTALREATSKAYAKVLGRPMNEHEKPLAEGLVKKATGEPLGSFRQKMSQLPPNAMRLGGFITTDRDLSYCPCGHTREEHNDEHAKQCVCQARRRIVK